MIPSWNIKTLLQRVRALTVTLCVVLLFLQNAAAQDTIKTNPGGNATVIQRELQIMEKDKFV